MTPNSERIPLDTNTFPNYLGVVLSHYCPTFLGGHTAEGIHFSLNWVTSFLDKWHTLLLLLALLGFQNLPNH
jgi:hypothetical protein